MTAKKVKIIQIAFQPISSPINAFAGMKVETSDLYALCDDGTIWCYSEHGWDEMLPITIED